MRDITKAIIGDSDEFRILINEDMTELRVFRNNQLVLNAKGGTNVFLQLGYVKRILKYYKNKEEGNADSKRK